MVEEGRGGEVEAQLSSHNVLQTEEEEASLIGEAFLTNDDDSEDEEKDDNGSLDCSIDTTSTVVPACHDDDDDDFLVKTTTINTPPQATTTTAITATAATTAATSIDPSYSLSNFNINTSEVETRPYSRSTGSGKRMRLECPLKPAILQLGHAGDNEETRTMTMTPTTKVEGAGKQGEYNHGSIQNS